MNNYEFAQFIDQLRLSRNMSREDLVEGIISLRHYYRFIKGETTINSNVLIQFLERLELSETQLFGNFYSASDELYKKLIEIYRKVYVDDLKIAYELFSSIEKTDLDNETNKKFYEFVNLLLSVKQDRLTYNEASTQLILLIDYPNVLKKDVLTFVEKSALIYLVNYLTLQKDYRIANFFYKIVQNEINNGSNTDNTTIPFRIITAKCLGIVDEHEKALNLLQSAQNTFIVSDNFLPMINLFYYKAVAEKKLYDDYRYRTSLQKMFALLNISDNYSIKEGYKKTIYKTFELLEQDLVEFK
ncbi:helix-turn-helix domain-containing protein [Candidatus Xianfuyuplasma coldseepsis]|uniref:Helix-turn-helix transcriptional regulator n=1 Tax=Candidatus Xianfuyuplasma coldseepsis TaxID=2782163 RepID=A0A7L7KTM9_9MOLU|nr:helix-turn-helix transcriptional regulator [Xianfuyuplasma coldseepsis]QMS85606.1 helix-turn-helix transcriptional regulator [Xianfuyuplasma coldseepsis]